MISAVVVCFNEESKLNNCLRSLEDFVGEMVVVDLGSTDKSVSIAKKFKAKIYHHKFVPFVELVRNYAISKVSGDWIFILDPDEDISDNLKDQLKELEKENRFVAVNIPRKNIFFGRRIKHSNWWPDYHVRFFKKGKVSWSGKIHIYPHVFGNTLQLEADENLAIIHHGYDNVGEFVDRQNRYSEIEAEQRFKEGERFSWVNFFWWPFREFLVRFVRHAGFLDGFYGFALTFLMMLYKIEVLVKLWEQEKRIEG